MFRNNHIHYQFKKGEVIVTHLETNKSVTKLCEALTHPRTLMGNFYEIDHCVKVLSKEVFSKSLFDKAPIAIVQLFGPSDGGYTNVELRAFREVVLGSGARDVYFPDTKLLLSSIDIINKNYICLED
ncbi:hypothetical protein [Vibrio campbellii]|uniref:Uncharacterized protein n=1 Tax=Vibrio campbellii TaxID=680 RepID=A0ABY5I9F5_9VIBR|nr:hypothetical protein [Vibrio campbellii]UTZ21659.1 hypothetical protein HB760_06845 [Vibrio campbellii]UTZ30952.1 hypothetical protein HB762_05855 [Vibrio campbellii]